MSKHSKERNDRALALMLAPEQLSVPEVAVRTGVAKATPHLWQSKARALELAEPAGAGVADGWSTRNPRRWSRTARRRHDLAHVWLNPPPKAATASEKAA